MARCHGSSVSSGSGVAAGWEKQLVAELSAFGDSVAGVGLLLLHLPLLRGCGGVVSFGAAAATAADKVSEERGVERPGQGTGLLVDAGDGVGHQGPANASEGAGRKGRELVPAGEGESYGPHILSVGARHRQTGR